ncbi:hypothetical protein [Clostridium sp. ZBS13]|nr:hypothetical protein [Clostridium sp. ZBS13]
MVETGGGGNFIGANALAAVGASYPITFSFNMVFKSSNTLQSTL